MKLELFNNHQGQSVIELFKTVFSRSEGESEGKMIGELVGNLLATTKSEDLIGFVATNNDKILGSIFFSSFVLESDQSAFLLSPVAIAVTEQGKGLGQKLINFGLNYLKSRDVDYVLTYGDPNFYSKVGFQQIKEDIIKAPLKLSFPEGWLAQSLNEKPLKPIIGRTQCVRALSDQKYW